MKRLLGVSLVALTLAGGQLAAQSTAATTGIAPLGFDGSILMGGRGEFKGNIEGGNEKHKMGFYAEPVLGVSYSGEQVDVAANYKLEAWSARGFGAANKEKSFGDNFHFMHAPNISITGKVNPRANLTLYAEMEQVTRTGNATGNELNFYVEPAVVFKVNDSFNVALSYYYERITSIDGDLSIVDPSGGNQNPAEGQTFSQQSVQAAINKSQDDISNMHTGKIATAWTINDRLSLGSYIRAGRTLQNKGNAGNYAYRLQNELKIKATPELNLRVRHRMNYLDTLETGNNFSDQRLRLIANYQFTDAMAFYLETEGRYQINEGPGAEAYRNDTEVGLLYTF